jgi:hypothetical protein
MRKISDKWKVESGKLGQLVSNTCGKSEYRQYTSVWQLVGVVHTYLLNSQNAVHKQAEKLAFIPLLVPFLCTVCKQLFYVITSVNLVFMHTIHRAYKDTNYLYKGIN